MQNTDDINLIMNVHPLANTGSTFSTTAEYVFYINSMASYGATATESQLVCRFASNTSVTCTVNGTSMVAAVNPTVTTGVTDLTGNFRIFAGLRNDPFFFDLDNFNVARRFVRDNAASLQFDTAGCPALDVDTRALIVNTLTGQAGGLPNPTVNSNFFGALNTLSIVIQADKTLFGNGPIYAVSAGTRVQ